MRLSVSMIVKDEAAQLATCLASVQGADEIVVVDTGSTDATVAIAQAHGATVYAGPEFIWRDDFAFHRNQSLDRCTGDWVLIIDADEELEPGGIAKARAAIERAQRQAIIVTCISATMNPSKPHILDKHLSVRLFQRDAARWRGRIHNYLTITDGDPSDLHITYGYSPAHAADPDRALRILTAVVAEDPTCQRERYYLAREHWYRRDYATAIREYDAYLARATWAPEMADAWLMKARCHWALAQGDAARAACLRAIQINTQFHEALTFMAALSGPKNAARWREWAETATNADVLFVRSAPKREQPAAYYDACFARDPHPARYDAIYAEIGAWAGARKLRDVGCGQAGLARFVADYSGFDFADAAISEGRKRGLHVWGGDVRDPCNYDDADCYAATEVLEHLTCDREVLGIIPSGSAVALTVPTFDDPGHLRTYDAATVAARYGQLITVQRQQWYGMVDGAWRPSPGPCHPGILLVFAERG